MTPENNNQAIGQNDSGEALLSRQDVSLLLDAISFAAVAHAEVGQLRAYTGEPYIVHPIDAVRILLRSKTTDLPTLMAGALHDVAEDTQKTVGMISERFGEEVAGLVTEVTNPGKPEGLTRAQRKALDLEHLAHASPRGQNDKCADVASNIGTGKFNLAAVDPKFAKTYLREKLAAMDVLDKADPLLWNIAMDRIQEGLLILKGIRLNANEVHEVHEVHESKQHGKSMKLIKPN